MATRTVTQSAANAAKPSLIYEITRQLNARANRILRDPGLRIVGGSASPLAEAQNAFHAIVQGTLLTVAAGTDMPALSGTVTADEFGIYVWLVDSAGAITQATLATGATLAAITFPTVPIDKAVVGAVIVNPTGTGDFVGGTDDLDDATVVPNAVFIDGNELGGLGDLIALREMGGLPT